MKTTRRRVLWTLGLGAAAVGLGGCEGAEARDERTPEPASDWEGVGTPDDALFPVGVQSGDPTPDGAVLWTRYDGGAALEIVVARWDGSGWVEDAPVAAEPADGGYVHVTVEGFEADQPLAFQFRDADGACSRVGHLRTAMAEHAAGTVVFGAGSCFSQGHGEFPALTAAMGRGRLDFFALLGDTVYCDGLETLEEFRALWESNLSKDSFRDVLSRTATVVTWDDHEVDNNWNEPPVDQEKVGIGTQAFFEHSAIRRHAEHADRIWRSLRFGRTAEIFVLDVRGERIHGEQYVSAEQLDWLKVGLLASPCTWKIVVTGVPFTDLPAPWDVDLVRLDRWDGYTQRDDLRDFLLEQGLRGVLFLTGDYHQPTLSRIDAEGGGAHIFEVWTGPGGSNPNYAGTILREEFPDQFPYVDAVWNATRIEVGPHGLARVVFVGEDDTTLCDALLDTDGNLLDIQAHLAFSSD